MTELEHTQRIRALIEAGKITEAVKLHNAHLKAEFDIAKEGRVIDLSDLMAAKEVLDQTRPYPREA